MAPAALQGRISCCHRRGGIEEHGNCGELRAKSLSDASEEHPASTTQGLDGERLSGVCKPGVTAGTQPALEGRGLKKNTSVEDSS